MAKALTNNDAIALVAVALDEKESRANRDAAFVKLMDYGSLAMNRALKGFSVPGLEREDIVQEIHLLFYWKHLASFDASRGSFESFMYIVSRGIVITILHRAHAKKNIRFNYSARIDNSPTGDEDLTIGGLLVDSSPLPVDSIGGREEMRRMVAELQKVITPLERMALNGKLMGYSEDEIAEVYSRVTGKRQCHRNIDNAYQRLSKKGRAIRDQLEATEGKKEKE